MILPKSPLYKRHVVCYHLPMMVDYPEDFEKALELEKALVKKHGKRGRRPLPAHLKHKQKPGNMIKKTRHWHEELVEFFILNPGASLSEAAEHFGKTISWISSVVNSASFKEYRARRMAEHREMVSQQVIAKTQGLALAGLERLERDVANDSPMTVSELTKATEMALRSLGFGLPRGPNVTVIGEQTNNAFGVPRDILVNARKKLAMITAENTEVLEGGEEADTEVEICPAERDTTC